MFYKAARGTSNHLAGLAAEHSVIAEYAGRAYHMLAHRWRDTSGEIDLIFADGDGLIFTEVKKSRSHDAIERCRRAVTETNCQNTGGPLMSP